MRSERAKIFAPFNPLKGMDAAYREKERVILPKAELMTDRVEEINEVLCGLEIGDTVRITYYSDGAYKKKTGRVNAILPRKGVLILDVPIAFSDIYDIDK